MFIKHQSGEFLSDIKPIKDWQMQQISDGKNIDKKGSNW